MRDQRGLAVADHDVGAAVQDRLDQARDIGAGILVVAVGVDDDVGAGLEAGVEPGAEGVGKAAVAGLGDDMIDAEGPRDLDRAVGRAVVDDQDLHLVDARDAPRNGGHGLGQRRLFVVAGDLDDELHGGSC